MREVQKNPLGPFWYAVVWFTQWQGAMNFKTMSGTSVEGVETTPADLDQIKKAAYPGVHLEKIGIDFTRFDVIEVPR